MNAAEPNPPDPIVNCHTHVFTGDYVPPYLAKTFVPWPFYYFISVSFLVRACRAWFSLRRKILRMRSFKWLCQRVYAIQMWGFRTELQSFVMGLAGIFLAVQVFYIILDWLNLDVGDNESTIESIRTWLTNRYLLFKFPFLVQLLLTIVLFAFFRSGRTMLLFVFKRVVSLMRLLPGPETVKLATRYMNIGRFAFYRKQINVFWRLKAQYPPGTRFVILPMDMEFMGAGTPMKNLSAQMEELADIKKRNPGRAHPFVFADPRRMSDASYFDWRMLANGSVELTDKTFVHEYLVSKGFSGIKIYPALGYYPFDSVLLPLWKYAADRGIPILTHCIRGTIFYRGSKTDAWDKHPVITDIQTGEKLDLLEVDNIKFINNFTHPLNYLCLLEERLLRKVVATSGQKIGDLFGYTASDVPLRHDLEHLKICFGHYGGDDEWERYGESDRGNYGSQVMQRPKGIDFMATPGTLADAWRYADWYSIISSLMLQYDHVYADLSYIIHNSDILPRLNQTLANPKLRTKVVFGTDFYVVRNHNSEKDLLAEITAGLSEADFDQIARINPVQYLLKAAPPPTVSF